MWTSKGRSGHGDSTIGGDYDSWDGLSMNGRQYKNEATMETRDLSGADYWHLRKQNRPAEEIPVELHMLKNGKANINAYAILDGPKKPVSKVSIKDKILPQFKRLNTLRSQMVELEREYKTTDMSISEYSVLRDVLVAKVQRAEVLYRKAIAQKPVQLPEDEAFSYAENFSNASDNNGHGESYSSPVGVEFIDSLSSENMFKSFLKSACLVTRTLVRLHNRTKAYVQTLKEV